jgi:hypothetical protein
MIDEPGHPTGPSRSLLKEETTMLKTISAALLAVSVLAAPALAATPAKDATRTQAPVIKTEQMKAKPGVLNANAKMGRHHAHYRHHRSHKHMGALKTHQKLSVKHITSATKRG